MERAVSSTCCAPRTFKGVEAEDPFYPVNSGDRLQSTRNSSYGKTMNSSQEGQLWLYNGGRQSDRLATS